MQITEEVSSLLKEVPNTNKRMKETIGKLVRNADQFKMDSLKNWMDENKWKTVEKITFDADIQTDKCTKEMSTQTKPWHDVPKDMVLRSLEVKDMSTFMRWRPNNGLKSYLRTQRL